MKFLSKIPVLAFLALITFAILTSCNSSAEKVADAKEDVTKAEDDLAKAQEEYFAEINAFRQESATKIADNEKLIAEFKEKIVKEKASVKAEYQEKITVLEDRNSAMKKRMGDYTESGKDKWQTFKKEFTHDMDELGQALNGLVVSSKK